jgi:broad specificity phosphatase PhoE
MTLSRRLYFVRHGQSEANVLRVISNRGGVHPLTELGLAQAHELADNLSGLASARLFCSPLLRAVQTAAIVGRALGIEASVTDALREYDCGDLEGKSDPLAWEAHAALKHAWIDSRQWHLRRPGGESFLDIRARFEPFLDGLLQEADPHPVVLVGHGGTYQCMLPLFLKNVDFAEVLSLPFPNTGSVLAESSSNSLVCRSWCGVRKD